MNKNIIQSLKVITLALVLSIGISYVSAWTVPTATPPSGNVSAPINVGNTDQTKLGSISAASFWDSNDPANFFVNPNGDSKLNNIFTTGNIAIGSTVTPTEKLEVNGNAKATAFLYSSDRNLKKNIYSLENSLEKISKLRGVSFVWKDTEKLSVGFIAQEVEVVYPELVNTDAGTGIKSVNYASLIAPLVEAVKSQQEEIERQQKEINLLKELIKEKHL